MMLRMMPALLVVAICMVPSGCMVPDVPPTMPRMSPIVMRSCRMRKCSCVNVGVDLALMKSTLELVS